jgi:metal-sulfur cluster biosynthetic enzyme
MIQRVYDIMQSVIDPDTGIDIFSMGITDVQNWDEQSGRLTIRFTPTNPMCPMAFFMANELRKKLKEVEEIKTVFFNVTNFARSKELQELMSDPEP